MSAPESSARASRSLSGMFSAESSRSASTKQMCGVSQRAMAAAMARPLPRGAWTTSAPSDSAISAEPSVESLSTNQSRSPASAAAAAWTTAFATVLASLWPMTANVTMTGRRCYPRRWRYSDRAVPLPGADDRAHRSELGGLPARLGVVGVAERVHQFALLDVRVAPCDQLPRVLSLQESSGNSPRPEVDVLARVL